MRSSRREVGVQHQLLQMLKQRPAGAVHHALRQAGGARGVHDVERVIERRGGANVASWRAARAADATQSSHVTAPRMRRDVRPAAVRYGTTTTRSISGIRSRDLADAGQAVDLLPGVAIAVGAEQHPRLDLPEAVEHAVGAEVGRARRPDRRRCSSRRAWRSRSREDWAGIRRPDRRRRRRAPASAAATARDLGASSRDRSARAGGPARSRRRAPVAIVA